MRQQPRHYLTTKGFTIIELAIAVAILGILSSVALPTLLNQLYRSHQQACVARMSHIITTTLQFYEEERIVPTGWKDLTELSAVMTTNGPATDTSFSEIDISNEYQIKASATSESFDYECTPINPAASNYNVLACLRLINGAVQINQGSPSGPAQAAVCI